MQRLQSRTALPSDRDGDRKLNVTVRAGLPPLAWLLEIDGAPGQHRLLCGSGVMRVMTR